MNAPLPSHAYRTSFQANAYQSFISGLKAYWGGELYREVVAAAEQAAAKDAEELESRMRDNAAYRLYGWLERRVQQFKWSGRYGFHTLAQAQKQVLEPLLAAVPVEVPGRLQLDPALKMPDYLTETETHQQPGGLWKDLVNAYAIAWYAQGPSFAGTNPNELVDWYARLIQQRCKEHGLAPQLIADLGCSAGRSTRAIKRVFPETRLVGCELCEPMVRHGHLRSIDEKTDITLYQRNAEDLGCFEDSSVDVVASHWLYHEMPPRAIRNSIRESRRVLKPGGLFAMYDMYQVPGGVIGEWLHTGYAARNNEPFAHTLFKMNLKQELEAAGFTDVRIELTSPQHSTPEIPQHLPPRRLHYMSFVSAFAPEV